MNKADRIWVLDIAFWQKYNFLALASCQGKKSYQTFLYSNKGRICYVQMIFFMER